jgi:predicted nucleic acid-binding protein
VRGWLLDTNILSELRRPLRLPGQPEQRVDALDRADLLDVIGHR